VREQIVAQLSASANVYKDFKCFNEHANPAFAKAFVCALLEQRTPTSRLEKKLKNTNFSLANEVGEFF